MREIRTLRALRRRLETGPRASLNGHEGGNPGHSQGKPYGPPRQPSTLPGSPKPSNSLDLNVPNSWTRAPGTLIKDVAGNC